MCLNLYYIPPPAILYHFGRYHHCRFTMITCLMRFLSGTLCSRGCQWQESGKLNKHHFYCGGAWWESSSSLRMQSWEARPQCNGPGMNCAQFRNLMFVEHTVRLSLFSKHRQFLWNLSKVVQDERNYYCNCAQFRPGPLSLGPVLLLNFGSLKRMIYSLSGDVGRCW